MARSGKVRVLVDDDQVPGQAFRRCLGAEFAIAPSRAAPNETLGSKEFDVLMGANDLNSRSLHDRSTGARSTGPRSANAEPLKARPGVAVSQGSDGNLRNGRALQAHAIAGQGLGSSEALAAQPSIANGNSSEVILASVVSSVIDSGRSLDTAMAEIEAAVIRAALKQQRGNRSAAARQLQLPRQTLQDRMKKHGLWSS